MNLLTIISSLTPLGQHGRGSSRSELGTLALATSLIGGQRAAILFGCVAAGVLSFPLNVSAQLPVGGFLGPDPTEQEVEERIEQQLEKRVEENVEDSVEVATELNIQENIEDNIEETIEQTVDATIEGTIDDTVAQTVEERVEESVESSVEIGVAEAVESSVEDGVEGSVEEAVAASVEDSVEEAVENELVASVESNVESSIESSVEADVEASVEESVEASVESTVEASVEEAVADSVEATVEETVADAVATEVEDSVEESLETQLESSVEDDVEQRVVLAIEGRLETEIDEILDDLESDLEVDEARILKEQWLVMAEPVVFEELTSRGYLFDTVTELPGLGLRLAEVAAPSTFDITQVRDGVLDVVGKDRAEVDLNHIYTAGVPEMVAGSGVMPRAAMAFPADLDELDLRVGMIDSKVDTDHPALAQSSITTRSFARPGAEAPEFHGTAIASIIAANSTEYRGLAPNAEVYAASVFELDGKRGEIASTVSLIRALDWLISSGVDVVNISLAGPPNRLLERAIDRASSQDMVVMAAAGNGGPVARPMYPAAYDSVVAVTAVDSAQQVFRLANRGDYLALAAPGVDLRHAQPGGGYAASSGTSFAVPFAVTAAARLSRLSPESDIITMLLESAMDLGPPGRDTIYGYGLLTLGSL
ncbi:S8 family serine peptidase [Congregibacter sp.]|uniref:S8 family serine peptidase n=1 Tax=Congregibacter sp. TaxID=2744308 RepID=UPI00385D0EC2